MNSTSSNFHFDSNADLPVDVDCRDDGDVWITVGVYPVRVNLFLTEAQAEKLRLSIVVALEEKYGLDGSPDDIAFELAARAERKAEEAREKSNDNVVHQLSGDDEPWDEMDR